MNFSYKTAQGYATTKTWEIFSIRIRKDTGKNTGKEKEVHLSFLHTSRIECTTCIAENRLKQEIENVYPAIPQVTLANFAQKVVQKEPK